MPVNSLPENQLLLPGNIQPHLQTKFIGREIFYFKDIDSTNKKAKSLAVELAEEGTMVIAETQHSGQGRLGRGWHSPFGKGIWVSVIFRPPFEIKESAKCTLLAAVAVRDAIEDVTEVSCDIKWPNDILWQGRKIVGILSELGTDKNGAHFLIIGVGINVNLQEKDFQADIAGKAASLYIASGQKINRVLLLASFAAHLERLYALTKNEGFIPVLTKWRKHCLTLGKYVDVFGENEHFNGLALDIDEEGALLVKTSAGVRKVLAGDVSIR